MLEYALKTYKYTKVVTKNYKFKTLVFPNNLKENLLKLF